MLGLLLACLALAVPAGLGQTPPAAPAVLVVQIDGAIGPASADFVRRGLQRGAGSPAALVVLQLDTPGGLDTSMRAIIKDILASPVPVAVFVAPEGARAASAGAFILYASHVAAMAPATNVGAATPVGLGGAPADRRDGNAEDRAAGDPAARKAINDAVAYLQGLAKLRGRNAAFAEQAVREARSVPADEALALGVVEVIAPDVPALLARLEGRTVQLAGGPLTLRLAGAEIQTLAPDWRNRTLAILSNPTLVVVLLMIGLYGLFIEFTTPGFGVPGVAGAIALLLALYALQLLPTNWAGLALLVLGLALMAAEVFLPSFGALGIGGLIAFVLGGLMLFDRDVPGFAIPLAWLTGLGLAGAVLIIGVGTLAWRARGRPVVSGVERLLGAPGVVEGQDQGVLWVRVEGALWSARAPDGALLAAGTPVRVRRVDGLVLEVVAQ